MTDLTQAESHFAFGENWKSFLSVVDRQRIESSDVGIERLFPGGAVKGKTVIDIGSGSGLPALSLLRSGATRVDCVDIDRDSVEATHAMLSEHAPEYDWSARQTSVLDLPDDQYDVVHCWGVLHHTGAMWKAIDKAASLVRPGGLFALAIYGKTPLCEFWKFEKKAYTNAPKLVQVAIRRVFEAACITGMAVKGKNPITYIRGYRSQRGMSWDHDQHDWLGGFPYESAHVNEMTNFLEARGFRLERTFLTPKRLGLTGTACDEYVFRKD